MAGLTWSNLAWAGGGSRHDWHMNHPRLAFLGDSLSSSAVKVKKPASVVGDGSVLTITFADTNNMPVAGDKIKLSGYQSAVCSELFVVASVNGAVVTAASSFNGTASKQFYYDPICILFQKYQGFLTQVQARGANFEIPYDISIPAAASGSSASDAAIRMDYELLGNFASDFDVCHVMLGTNDLNGAGTVAGYVPHMRTILTKLKSAGKRVILGAIPAISASGSMITDAASFRAKILEANAVLAALAAELGFPFIDYYAALVGPDGWARPEYMNSDGVHHLPDGDYAKAQALLSHTDVYFTGKNELPVAASSDNVFADPTFTGTKASTNANFPGTVPTIGGVGSNSTMTGTTEMLTGENFNRFKTSAAWTAAGQRLDVSVSRYGVTFTGKSKAIFHCGLEVANASEGAALDFYMSAALYTSAGNRTLTAFEAYQMTRVNGTYHMASFAIDIPDGVNVTGGDFTAKFFSRSASGSVDVIMRQPAIFVS